ncbi:MAG: hypothetical protein E7629_06570 [Ruminococcaceae bacterium]|nr:hypothetical protein [Oscillospiraceae bacterium]
MWKKIYEYTLRNVGLACLVWMVYNAFLPQMFTTKVLYVMVTFVILMSLLSIGLFPGKQLSYRQIWFRRSILLGLGALGVVACLRVLGLSTNSSPKVTGLLFLRVLLLYLAIQIPLYFISDYMEKRALKKINEKLGENQ